MNFLGMGPAELLLVLALALIVFGPDKMPEIARQIGKAVGELRRVSSEVTRELQRSIQEEQPGSGPRIVRQSSPSASPPLPAPTAPAPVESPTTSEEPRILAPSNGGVPTPTQANGEASPTAPPALTSPVQGPWEDGPTQPTTPDRGLEPRRPA